MNRYQKVFEHALNAIVLADDQAHIVEANPAACNLLGYRLEELQQLSIWDITLTDNVQFAQELWKDFIEAGQQKGEFTLKRKDGSVVDTEYVAVANIAPGLHLSILRDISEREAAMESLQLAQARLTSVLESVADLYILFDRQWRYLYVNDAAVRAIGRPREQILGRTLWELFSDITGTELERHYRRAMEERVPVAFDFHYTSTNTWWENRFYPAPEGLAVFATEITERKQAEIEIKQRSERLSRANALISALSQVAAQLLIHLDSERVMEILCNELKRLQTTCIIATYDPREQSFVIQQSSVDADVQEQFRALTGLQILGARLTQQQIPFFVALVEQGKTIFVTDPLSEAVKFFPGLPVERLEQVLGLVGFSKATPAIGLPLLIDDQWLGTITIWGDDLREEDTAVFSVFASQVTIALENARLFEQVSKGREHLQILFRQLVEIQEKERRQIARELHDEIGQILTGLKFLLEMSAHLPAEERETNFAEAKSLVNDLMVRVQEISLDLRPAMLDDLGLLPALLWHFGRFKAQTGVAVNFKHTGLEDVRFPAELETAAYRIVQETLTNIARYAGVKTADVRVWADGQGLHLIVDDKGKGFDLRSVLEAHNTSGIPGMRERAILCGGKLIIDSAPGKGTQVYAALPLNERLERRSDDRLDRPG